MCLCGCWHISLGQSYSCGKAHYQQGGKLNSTHCRSGRSQCLLMPNPNLRAEALHSSICLAGFLFQRQNWLPLTEHHSCRTPSCAWFLSWYSTFLELAGECNRLCVCAWVHAQSCLTLCNPIDCSLPGSSVHGIFPTRILRWVAISSSGDPISHLLLKL